MLLESNTVDWAGMSLSADNSELGPRTRSQILVENVGGLYERHISLHQEVCNYGYS